MLVGILIFIHESGHFLFAKLFGVGVRVFSLGFGRRLFGFVYGGTDYRVSLLPIGGYVMMEGADPFQDGGDPDADPDSPGNFLNKPVWQRLIIVAAGPVFNLILPVVVFSALFMAGIPEQLTVLGQVDQRTPAAQAGLQRGDKIVEVGGQPVGFWMDLSDAIEDAEPGQTLSMVVERGGARVPVSFSLPEELPRFAGRLSVFDLGMSYAWQDTSIGVDDPDSPAWQGGLRSFDFITEVGAEPVSTYVEVLEALNKAPGPVPVAYQRVVDAKVITGEALLHRDPAWHPPTEHRGDPTLNDWGIHPGSVFIMNVVEDSAAEEGGLRVGDRLLAIDGGAIATWGEVMKAIDASQSGEGRAASARPVALTLVRDGAVIEKSITPKVVSGPDRNGEYRAMVGIGSGGGSQTPFTELRHFPPGEAIAAGADLTWKTTRQLVSVLGKLFTGEVAASKTLGGPIQIFRDASQAAEQGLFAWASMMAGLSISLGVINFLPVPVLDGGQFLFYLLEGIRGRPLPLVVRERALQIGVLFLVGLMFMVFIFDVNRWLAS